MSETPDSFVDDARRYSLGSRIATGGMGEVWRGTDTVLGRSVAIKLLKVEYADDPTFRSRFETEARHAASLLHPGVAAVYDFGEASPTDGSDVHRPYLVMELVDGEPLSALLASGRALDPDVTRDLMAQAADAIGAAHAAGIVHRDVKPANLLVTPDRQVKITDFGIARATEGMALTETGQVMGTPQYLSPEQAQGGSVTPASDVYSLGVVAFECLAGQRPYVRETAVATALAHLRDPIPELPGDVPTDLAAVVRQAMSKSPEDRFPDATAFAAALRDPSSAAAAGAAAAAAAAGVAAGAAASDSTQVMGAVPPPVTSASGPATGPVTGPVTASGHPVSDHRAGRSTPWGWILLAVAIVAGIVLVAVLANGTEDEPELPTPTRSEGTRSPEPSEEPTSEAPSESSTPSEEPSEKPSEKPSEEPSEEPSETVEPSLPTETTASQSPDPSPSPTSSTASPSAAATPSGAATGSPSTTPTPTQAAGDGAPTPGDSDQ